MGSWGIIRGFVLFLSGRKLRGCDSRIPGCRNVRELNSRVTGVNAGMHE